MCISVLTAGFSQPVNCVKATGGFVDDAIYIFNSSEIASGTPSATLGEVTDIVMTGATTAFLLGVEKDSFNFTETRQEDGTWTQVVTFMLKSDTSPEANFVASLNGVRLCFIGRDRNDKFPMAGFHYVRNATTPASSTLSTAGLELTEQVGDWSIENFGRTVTMTGVGFKQPAPYFYETSIAATVANLVSYL